VKEPTVAESLSIFKVEYVTTERGKRNGDLWRHNHTTWVLIDGDAQDAAAAVKGEHPDAIVHVVRRHASGASVLIAATIGRGEET
jgi:hypothetical protein